MLFNAYVCEFFLFVKSQRGSQNERFWCFIKIFHRKSVSFDFSWEIHQYLQFSANPLSLSLFLVCQWKNFFLTHFHPKEKPAQINVSFRFNRHFVKSYIKMHVEMLQLIYQSISMRYLFIGFSEVTNNGRPMNPSLSEDSVADTAISKRNSDGMIF